MDPAILFNPFPNNKILDWSKLEVFADDKINVTKKIEFFFFFNDRKHCGKGENAGYQHFLLFPQCFQRELLAGLLKDGIVW